MNEPAHKDFAHAGLAVSVQTLGGTSWSHAGVPLRIQYGNNAYLNYQFSAASILVVVPPSSKRMLPPSPSVPSTSAESRERAPSYATSTAVDTALGSDWNIAGKTSPAGSIEVADTYEWHDEYGRHHVSVEYDWTGTFLGYQSWLANE